MSQPQARALHDRELPPASPRPARRGWSRGGGPAVLRSPLHLPVKPKGSRSFSLFVVLLFVAAGVSAAMVPYALYPLRHRDSIVKYARQYSFRPSLVASLIRQESRFRTNARSPIGAMGLMQLLPSTARWVSEDLQGSPFAPESLQTPKVNLSLGAAYLAHLRERFGEEPVLYLSAYNAGPQCVREWMAGRATALRVSEIPYPETRAYVDAVLRGQVRYAQLYPSLDLDP